MKNYSEVQVEAGLLTMSQSAETLIARAFQEYTDCQACTKSTQAFRDANQSKPEELESDL